MLLAFSKSSFLLRDSSWILIGVPLLGLGVGRVVLVVSAAGYYSLKGVLIQPLLVGRSSTDCNDNSSSLELPLPPFSSRQTPTTSLSR
jgi:hypothetical protein